MLSDYKIARLTTLCFLALQEDYSYFALTAANCQVTIYDSTNTIIGHITYDICLLNSLQVACSSMT